jgi:methyltransferase (TIGR00027 family)
MGMDLLPGGHDNVGQYPADRGGRMSESLDMDVSQRSIEFRPSETAMATAVMRFLAAHDEREEIRGSDYLAGIFLAEDRRAALIDPAVRQRVMKNKIAPGAYEFMIARTAFFDHVVRDALVQSVPQVVLLGAGYDSRPYRFRDLVRDSRIFELDARPTQLRKKEILDRARIPIPRHLALVSIDFSRENLTDVLLGAGFSRDKKALFVWEGVTYYLSPHVVDDTFLAVKTLSAAGSSLCLDYASLSPEALSNETVREWREHMKSKYPAEPTRFGIPHGKLEEFLADRGYAVIENLNPSEMEAKYLTLRDGSTAGKVPAIFSLVHAALLGQIR